MAMKMMKMEKQAVVVAECGNCKGKICLIIK